MRRIVARAAVAEADVEIAVRTEREVAAVVIGERLRDERRPVGAAPAQIEPRRGIGDDRVRRAAEARDDGVAGAVGEVDEEAAARRRVRRKREPEQSLLAARDDRGRQVEKVGRRARRRRARRGCGRSAGRRTGSARSAGSCTNAIGDVNPDACVARPQLRVQIGGDDTRETRAIAIARRFAADSLSAMLLRHVGRDSRSRYGRQAHGILDARVAALDRRSAASRRPAGRGVRQVVAATARGHAASRHRDDQRHGADRLGSARRRCCRAGGDGVRPVRRRHAIGACRRTCATAAAAADGFACSARLPTLPPERTRCSSRRSSPTARVLESERSASLSVTVVAPGRLRRESRRRHARVEIRRHHHPTRRSRRRHASRRRTGRRRLEQPTDLAFAPDGRMLVAERAGTIRICDRAGHAVSEPALSSRTDGRPSDGSSRSRSIRSSSARGSCSRSMRDVANGDVHAGALPRVGDTLGDRAVLLDGIRAATPEPAAALRFGPDGKLYAAFDDGGDPRRRATRVAERQDAAAQSRRDDAARSGRCDAGVRRRLTVARRLRLGSRDSAALWMADARARLASRPVRRNRPATAAKRVASSATPWRCPRASRRRRSPSTAALRSRAGRQPARRVRQGRQSAACPIRSAGSLARRVDRTAASGCRAGQLVAVAAGPDGAIYFATADSVWRLVPTPQR